MLKHTHTHIEGERERENMENDIYGPNMLSLFSGAENMPNSDVIILTLVRVTRMSERGWASSSPDNDFIYTGKKR